MNFHIHEMGFMQYYKTAKNIPNPHSKIEYFIHITNFKKYPQKKKKKLWFLGYTCWEMESCATL